MKQNDIWLIDLDPIIGAEIRKSRPAIIVNDNALGKLPLKVIVPLTDWKEKYSHVLWMIKILPNELNGLLKISAADCFQIRSVSKKRFVKKIGEVESNAMDRIRIGIAKVLSMNEF